jgi:hypothetical protein
VSCSPQTFGVLPSQPSRPAWQTDLEKLLKKEGHMPEDKSLLMSRKGKRLSFSTILVGVFFGAATVGTSGSAGERVAELTASARSFPAADHLKVVLSVIDGPRFPEKDE